MVAPASKILMSSPSSPKAVASSKPQPRHENVSSNHRARPPRPNYRHIHRFPLPLTVHPLPPLIPHNPLSIISVALSYLTFFISPPHRETYHAYFDSATSSVHVTNEKTIRALWEMGFFGKGSLSRSEPSWLEREKKRRGLLEGATSEEITGKRRVERRELKLERARMEKLAIEERLKSEAAARQNGTVMPSEISTSVPGGATNGTALASEKFSLKKAREARTHESQRLAGQSADVDAPDEASEKKTSSPSKSVRFSPVVQEREFSTQPDQLTLSDPPNQEQRAEESDLKNEEHLQLSNEEAFFLAYGLGVLQIFDEKEHTVIPSLSLFSMFTQHSYFPPREPSANPEPDNPFVVSYAVYHHFRSLGWVVRSGVKFGVDYLLYNRGPVFSHAEFAVVVLPSYDHPYWSETEARREMVATKQARSWWWLHGVNRVQAQVKKSLVLCYVEIPPPMSSHDFSIPTDDIGAYLRRYRVREISIKRWVPNRSHLLYLDTFLSIGLAAGVMNSQEDSVDIARLKRVALGLYELSQPCSRQSLIALETAQEVAPGTPNKGTERRSSDVRLENLESSSNPADTTLPSTTHFPPYSQRHASSPLITSTVRFGSALPQSASAPQSKKMSSADTPQGDTQVVSQSVYDGLIRHHQDTGADGATLVTLHEGDTGHINLLSGLDDLRPATNDLDDAEDSSSARLDDESSPLHYQPDLFPESQRFLATTPATIVKDSRFAAPSTVTPSISRNPLASTVDSSGGIMALSQVFKATQAPSSPLVNGPQADLMSDRPSPNIPIQNRPLGTNFSSPFMSMPPALPRESSDGHLTYISMKESQAARNKRIGERATRSADDIYSEDHSDDEFGKEPSFVERLRRQRRIDEEAHVQLSGLTAPARSRLSLRGRQSPEQSAPSHGKLRSRSWTGGSAIIVVDEDGHESTVAANCGASEEETEQEDLDELDAQVAVSQPLQSSTEEDKENFDITPLPAVVSANTAHDRLSQALALHESPSTRSRISMPEVTGSLHKPNSSPTRIDHPDDLNRSSQVFIVKDSQQSPGRKEIDGTQESLGNRAYPVTARYPYSRFQVDPSSDLDGAASSPVRKPLIQSSPIKERERLAKSNEVCHDVGSHNRSLSASTNESASELPEPLSNPQDTHLKSGPVGSQHLGRSARSSGIELRDKSSSMPSRVAETPLHPLLGSFGDAVPAMSIPETSPNRLTTHDLLNNDEILDDGDDDLPPPYPIDHDRIRHSQAADPLSLPPTRPTYNPKILSSPSGRQRRRLTEIAADVSPQIGTGPFDIDLGIFTAEDREFGSLVGLSPIPPRKKRRGKDGAVFASDPVIPTTPRFIQQPHEERQEAVHPSRLQPTESSNRFPSRRPRTPRATGSLWDVEESPESSMASKARSSKFLESRHQSLQASPTKRSPRSTAAQPAPIVKDPSLVRRKSPRHDGPEEEESTTLHNSSNNHPETSDNSSTHPIIAPNQVFAHWKGPKRAYYPATCFGTPIYGSSTRYVVKFEDSPFVEVPLASVKRLDLRVGDAVKVDMPNVPKVTHIVRGFADKLEPEEMSKPDMYGFIPVTDVYGHSTLILGPKQRKSLPVRGLSVSESTIKVPLSRIYLDTILWNQLKDRSFSYISEREQTDGGFKTPSDRHATPVSPSTRLSRSINFFGGLFAGMVFAVSFVENEDAKDRVTKLIRENGGQILREGFNELFEMPASLPLAAPTRSPTSGDKKTPSSFRLTRGAETVGFACLIADKHSRREKYMQALALNLPCLAGRWVEDCVAQNRIVDWEMYLLPAGESMYLGGATKSRVLPFAPAHSAQLSQTITARPKLLEGQSVLLVMGRGKAEEKRKAYIFLTYALGASCVERVHDLRAAKAVLDQPPQNTDAPPVWDWVYVDDFEQATARKMLLGAPLPAGSQTTQSSRGRKRKRSEVMDSTATSSQLDHSRKPRIVGNEFVCQSLILGKLFEE
ncbi:hypothetical protein ASPZODRAFT_61825 [Penicilliopsis zonata CBS 506.65]|uniref:tRNA-intron lyase n=1 Tax=Penicilliopsis zonata CBS 506.65 TaxID=1073090 RepID=A0A1L9SMY7_9EURO|nr:hypothetical protein ASPZODRAFT_61825 [Penicilliopsis zonata CBS 506.65]OJJ48461.1 hypothetical protein ASPZODRAFT_61825 [Penicilliopsis zonata CBS 506.65]